IEHNPQVGKKILISGGGRCNFTNLGTEPENFISANPHFCKSALAGYTPDDFVRLVRKHRIPYYEKKLGQLFCRESSRRIVDMLLAECGNAGVEIRTSSSVRSLRKNTAFELETTTGDLRAESVVIASGGRSFPKIGASDLGYRIAKQFSIKMTPTRPSLVAMVQANADNSKLAGISLDSVVSTGKRSFHENILFTHRGMSGPAVLQISNYWEKGKPVSIDLMPDIAAAELLYANRDKTQTLANFIGRHLPQRFAESFVEANLPNKPLNKLSDREIRSAGEILNNWRVQFTETEGFGRAEVTLGGISTDELSSQTMESKNVKGLYFIGEVVDVTGWLGGYNFQWAWASGFAAGRSIK
ncbi:MAG TPA: NAD(P)/FAD-dependent oxidoreductase, partial [Pyrinomonadaceae bacterium]|nr:NAD(P)/FAD-dependent oxidoreductase [Pyrinomonadaceae bacterium]